MTITIYGYESFQAWKDAGYPGAVNGDTGERNPYPYQRVLPPPKPDCSVPKCERIATTRGMCYLHYERQRVREKSRLVNAG